MVDEDGDEIGRAECVTLPQGFMAGLGSATWCTEPGCPAAVLRNRRLAFHFVIVEHVEAHPFEVGNARRQKRSAPTTPRRSKTAHADFLITLSSSLARPGRTPPGQSTVFTAREPARGRGGDMSRKRPPRRYRGRRHRPSLFPSIRADGAPSFPNLSVPSRG
jgi:hypothetical protein